jgi:hypothetical protein
MDELGQMDTGQRPKMAWQLRDEHLERAELMMSGETSKRGAELAQTHALMAVAYGLISLQAQLSKDE